MNIRYFEKRPGAWHLDIRLPDGRRLRPYGGPTEAAARREEVSILSRILAPNASPKATITPVKLSGVSLQDAYKLALKTRESWITSKSKTTLQQTFESLGVEPEEDCAILTRDYVRDLRTLWLKEEGKRKGSTLSASTINHRLSMLSVLLETVDLPPHNVKHLSTKGNSRRRRFTDTEMKAACSWCYKNAARKGALDLADLITVGIGTGARLGELLGLQWSEVAAETLTFLDTKNGLSRTIPLRPAVRAVLDSRRALPAPFLDLRADRVTVLWADMREALGLAADEQFVFHLLRHESVQRMIDDGASTLAIMAWHGHESVATTEGYSTVGLAAMRRAAGMVPEPLREAA